jgi:hypothetical protein
MTPIITSPFEKGGFRGIFPSDASGKSPLPPFFKGGNDDLV